MRSIEVSLSIKTIEFLKNYLIEFKRHFLKKLSDFARIMILSECSSIRKFPIIMSTFPDFVASPSSSAHPGQYPPFLQVLIDDLIHGTIVMDEKGDRLLYSNHYADRILRQFVLYEPSLDFLPPEIRHICKSFIETRKQFPHQHWVTESEIVLDNTTSVSVQARWLNLDLLDTPCLVVLVRDQQRSMKKLMLEEAQHYGLTSREQEIWMLHRNHYTYKQIADELHITHNTVKKHLKSIRVKQKAYVAHPSEIPLPIED
jgi:DNA-binding CsgD family transcriptional regulator